MKTTLDVVDLLWSYINASSLKTTIAGKIYKHNRPVNSKSEDIVINCLPMNNEQLQEGIVNVNIFVPNKVQQINGVEDRSQADTKRLKTLSALACTILNDVFVSVSDAGYGFEVQQQGLIQDNVTSEWYSNIRINFYNINL